MAGICGIALAEQLRGREHQLRAVSSTLRHRGTPEHSYSDDFVSLCTLHKSSARNRNHTEGSRADGFMPIVAFDGRIDDRDHLASTLGLPGDRVCDRELMAASYRAWGHTFAKHIYGEFAIAIWDSETNRLVCARDQFGVRPFYYYFASSESPLLFASELKAILAHPDVPTIVNAPRLREIALGRHSDAAATSYKNIFRLPPASVLTWSTNGRIDVEQYWSLDPSLSTIYSSDRDYQDAFRTVLYDAVSDRMAGSTRSGVHLSGGLDSSAVFRALTDLSDAPGKDVIAFSNVFPSTPEADESQAISAILARIPTEHRVIAADEVGPLDRLSEAYRHEDEPLLAGNYYLVDGLARCAADEGVSFVMTGIDGDTVVMSDYVHCLHEYLTVWGTDRFLQELQHSLSIRGISLTSSSLARMIAAIFSTATSRRDAASIFFKGLLAATKSRVGTAGFLKRFVAFEREMSSYRRGHVPYLTSPIDLRDEVGDNLRQTHYRRLTSPLGPLEFELWNRSHAARGIEVVHPFWDRRVVEFCYGLPVEQRLRRGYSRYILRTTFEGKLPAEVVWSANKTSVKRSFINGLFQKNVSAARELLEWAVQNPCSTAGSIDYIKASSEFERLLPNSDRPAVEVTSIWNALTHAEWARSRNTNSIDNDRIVRKESPSGVISNIMEETHENHL